MTIQFPDIVQRAVEPDGRLNRHFYLQLQALARLFNGQTTTVSQVVSAVTDPTTGEVSSTLAADIAALQLWKAGIDTDQVPEGANNLYYTATRARDAAMCPYYVAVGDTFTVPEYKQVVYAMPIEIDGDVVVDGYLVEA